MPQKKKNAFFMFMLEKKPEVERRLRRKVVMAELPDILYEEWQVLSEEEKFKYKSSCGTANVNRTKCDSRGIPISVLLGKQEEEALKMAEMRKTIKTTIDMLRTGKSLSNGHFFVICITHYIHLEDDTYVPAEIGVCQFSFARGVFSTYHKIIPARIPTGYRHEATQHSEATHNLLLSRVKNVAGYEELYKFLLKEGSKLPNLYTQNEFMESVESMLKSFKLKSPVKVYSLDYLFQHLYSASIREIPESIASHFLQSSEFDYAPTIACSWHQEMALDASKYCALSYAHRWIFNMCNSIRLQETFNIKPVVGKHYADIGTIAEIEVYQPTNASVYEPKIIPAKELNGLRNAFSYDNDEEFDTEDKELGTTKPIALDQKLRNTFVPDSVSHISVEKSAEGVRSRAIGGVQISCLGLSGFGRGKKKESNSHPVNGSFGD